MTADRNRTALPRDVVRDLLGITRALYRAKLAGARDPRRLVQLEDIGRTYQRALDLARAGPDTMGGRPVVVGRAGYSGAGCVRRCRC
jgi:hypothetical protein